MKKFLLSLFVVLFTFVGALADTVTMAYSGSTTANMTGNNDAATVGLDETAWSVVGAKGGANNFPGLNKAGQIRLYWHANGVNTITVTSLTEATIESIQLTLSSGHESVTVLVDNTAVEAEEGVYPINSTSFVLANGYDSNVQVWIESVEITYTQGDVTVLKPTFTPASGATFTDELEVSISNPNEGGTIYYTTDGGDPTAEDAIYAGPFTITATTTVKAVVATEAGTSSVAEATYTKIEKSTIAEVLAAEAGTSHFVEGIVVAAGDAGFVVQDDTGYIYYYKGSGNTVTVGAMVQIYGAISTYKGVNQFPAAATVTEVGQGEVIYPDPTELDGADLDFAVENEEIDRGFYTFTGTLTISGNYYNFAVEGAENATACIIKPLDDISELNGKEVAVEGYALYVSGKYVYFIATEIAEVLPTFTITQADGVEYGHVTIEPAEAGAGATVTVTAVPENGYVLESIAAYGVNTNEAVVLQPGETDNIYTFEMIADDVVVSPVFVEAPFEPTDLDVAAYTGAWQSDVGNVGNYTKDVAQKEQYLTNTTTNGKILYQTIEGLENGTYTVSLVANASYTFGRGFDTDAQDGDLARVQIFANDVEKTIPVIYQTGVGTNNVVVLENVTVTDGLLEIGLRKDMVGSNWHTIQITGLRWESKDINPDAEAAAAYWHGVRNDILALDAYQNVQGDERAAVEAAEDEAGLLAAVPAFYAAKADADAAVLLAEREAAYADASEENPMVTDFVVNPSFNDGTSPWKSTTGASNQGTATNQDFPNKPFWENWNGNNYSGKMYQEIRGIPNGVYELSMWAFANNFYGTHQFVFANGDKTALTQGAPAEYTVRTIVVDNKIEIGLLQDAAVNNWMGIDDAVLTYLGKVDYKIALAEAIGAAETVDVDAPMNATKHDVFVDAFNNAVATYGKEDATDDEVIAATVALKNTTADAEASISAYVTAKEAIDAMESVLNSTNVVTAAAYETYQIAWMQNAEAWNEGTLDEAVVNPLAITGWRANPVASADFLYSAWEVTPYDWNDYHVNTWSTEGFNDGTNFNVPFMEYWTGDANSLGTKTLTATVPDLLPGNYEVSAWVRVRVKNGDTDAPYGISMKLNEGTAVDVCAGEQVGTSQFYLDTFTAAGVVGEDGTLTFSFDVADNNISWLAFQNVTYTRIPDPIELAGAFSWENDQQVTAYDNLEVSFTTANLEDNGYDPEDVHVEYTVMISDNDFNLWTIEGSVSGDLSQPVEVPFEEAEDMEGDVTGFTVEAGKTYEIVMTAELFDADGNKLAEIPQDGHQPHVIVIGYADALLDAAAALLEENPDGIAIGKLLAAVSDYQEGTADAEALQAAMNQFVADNADQEKDETAKVSTTGWKNYNGSNAGVCATQFAPAIDTYDGRKNVNLAEVYETTTATTGTIIYQDITGLTNGTYKVGFYGNAFFTDGRGFSSTMEDGADDVAYVFANDQREFIVARIATSTTENNFRQFDVEVTDGTIKLGMGKDKEGTNWHTMQIYQLTWFTTAKEVFEQDQAELSELLIDANLLLNDANMTEGKEALQEAIEAAEGAVDTDWYNIAEVEEIIANLDAAMKAYVKANYFIDFTAGKYYVIDAETGLMMAAGHNWGTHGIVNEPGLDLTLTPDEESRTVTFDSEVSNGGNNHFLSSELWMDGPAYGWALLYQGFGFYITNGEQYINYDDEYNLVLSDTPREWIIVTKEGVMEERMEELADATETEPVDATFLIGAPNFNRNDARNAAWQVVQGLTGDGHSINKSGGCDETHWNACAEAYHTDFSFTQTIAGVPAGKYTLTAQGFFRQDTGAEAEEEAPHFFANEATADVPVKTGEEGSMNDAGDAFAEGLYTIEPIEFIVGDDGTIVLGVEGLGQYQWVTFDNFQLTYYGPAAEPTYTIAIPDLAGAEISTEPAGEATAGTDVVITVTPEEGYSIDNVQVLDEEGNVAADVIPADGIDNQFLFTMPAKNVRIDVTLAYNDPNDFTYLIENPAYLHEGEAGTADYAGWTWTPAPGESGWKYRDYDAPMNLVTYSGNVNFSFYQDIPEVPAGEYRLSVYGFYRPGSVQDEANRVANGDPVHNLAMYAEIGNGIYMQNIMNLYEGATEENVIGKDFHPMVAGYESLYCPDGAGDSRAFYIAGAYRNDLIINVTEAGPVRIGINHPEGRTYDSDYAPIGAWELYKIGEPIIPVEVEELYVERETGLGYTTSSATVDFTAAADFLGVEDISEATLVVVNPDGTEIEGYAAYDGWFDADGVATTWGSTTKINVKFFQAIPEGTYTICDMNGADEIGAEYLVKWALKANGKTYQYNITVKFIEPAEVPEVTTVGNLYLASAVEYDYAEGSYMEKTSTLDEEAIGAILTELGIASLDEAYVYGYNPTTQTFLPYSETLVFDGWRDANGDFHNWSGNSEVPMCVKYDDGITYYCYNIAGGTGEDATLAAYWAFGNADGYAVLVEIPFIYSGAPGPVELTYNDLNILATEQVEVAFDQGTTYQEETATFDVAAFLGQWEQSLEDVTIYAVQSDGTLDPNYKLGTTDGWRNKEGDWTAWGSAYYCVKADFSLEENQFYYIGTKDPATEHAYIYTTKYVFVVNGTEGDALELDLVINYGDVVGINGILAGQNDEQTIYDLSGRRVKTITKGGMYIINGKKVFVK